jgi:hypothetical protein
MFARILGPFFAIVPATVAVRSAQMRILLSEFEANPMWAWVSGAFLLMSGLIIIGLHQYWRSAAAIMVSLLGWFLAVRGVLLLTVPQLYNSAGNALTGPVSYVLVRVGFGGLMSPRLGTKASRSRSVRAVAFSVTQEDTGKQRENSK